MIRLNISEVKAHPSKYLTKLRNDYTALLCKSKKPIAEIQPIKRENRGPRPIGLDKGRFVVPKNINDPLPDWLLDLFEGKEPK
jgi:antitoxin (DNA-binding transcriptional repressor) of toxin-antitoxin stability system